MNARLSFFNCVKNREITGRLPFKTMHNISNQRASNLLELFVLALSPDANSETRRLAYSYETELKELASAGVATALDFYRNIIVIKDMSILVHYQNQPGMAKRLAASMKEIAIQIKDPELLFNLYQTKTRFFIPGIKVNFEDAFNCLIAAAEMEGEYATKAAYCLANLYGQELINILKLRQGARATPCGALRELSCYFNTMRLDMINHYVDFTTMLKQLKALAKFGSSNAHQYLAHLYTNGRDNVNQQLQGYVDIEINTELANYHQQAANDLLPYLKERFTYYFDLSLKRTLADGTAVIECVVNCRTLTLTFSSLVELDIRIKFGDQYDENKLLTARVHYFNYISMQAKAGKIGALWILACITKDGIKNIQERDKEQAKKWFTQLMKMPIPTNSIMTQAARCLYELNDNEDNDHLLLEQAAQLGCFLSAYELGKKQLPYDSSDAINYFQQAIANSENRNSIRRNICSHIRTSDQLNCEENINYYFRLCADGLKDFTSPIRVELYTPLIVAGLEKLTKYGEEKPSILDELAKENYFAFKSRADIDVAMEKVMEAAKATSQVFLFQNNDESLPLPKRKRL